MKKTILTIDVSKLPTVSSEELLMLRAVHGVGQRFLHLDSLVAVRAEIERRAAECLAKLGADEMAVTAPDWDHGYPAAELEQLAHTTEK